MGFIRGSLVSILSVLLFLAVLLGGIFLALSSSLKYETIQPKLFSATEQTFRNVLNVDKQLEQQKDNINSVCQNNPEYVFTYENYNFNIPCSVAIQGTDVIINSTINAMINSSYYQQYTCKFIKCFEKPETSMFLLSEQGRNTLTRFFYWSLLISFVIIVLMFLLIEKKTSLPILAGISVVIPGVMIMKLPDLVSIVVNKLFSSQLPISDMIMIFLSEAKPVGIKMIVIGGIVFLFGIVLKMFKLGLKISSWIEEIKSEKKKPEKAKPQQKSRKK